MKKIVIKSTLPEDTIIASLKTLTDDLRSRKLLSKTDELIDGLEELDDKTFQVSINGSLMNPSNYKLIAPELKKLGQVVSNDLKNFDDEESKEETQELKDENQLKEQAEKEKVVDQQSVTPALSMHDTKELLLNVENMSKIESLLFSDEELGKTPENPETKVEEKKDPEPEKKEPETKEHDDQKEDPKPAEPAKAAEENKDAKPETTDPKPEDVKPEEGKPELHDGEEKKPEEPKKEEPEVKDPEKPEEKEHDEVKPEEEKEPEEKNFDTLYFSQEELQNYQTLLFDIEAEKKAEEEKKEEKKDPEDPKPAAEAEKEAKKEELHDGEGKPMSGAPKGPEPAKKSLKETLEEYEKTKKPYTNEAVASECGCTVEEVSKMKKELGLMDAKRDLPIDADKALKALADIRKKAEAGKDLNIVEKYFCDAMKQHFSDEEIEKAAKDAAPVDRAEVTANKMELVKELNKKAAEHNLGLAAKELNRK